MRQLDDWIDGFMEYTEGIPSPEVYRRWTAHTIISGALERKVWSKMGRKLLYPNLLILLVGIPGVGKSMAINEATNFWGRIERLNIAPTGMTKAAFMDQLLDNEKQFTHEGHLYMYSPLCVSAPEFGTLFPEYDSRFLNAINDVYDCNEVLEDRTRGGGKIHINRPHITMIAGTQPKYLGELLPDSAYNLGFTSRMIMVYASEGISIDLFTELETSAELRGKLVNDLNEISELIGNIGWTRAAREFGQYWYEHVKDDAPGHPRLQNYNNRRAMHGFKIAMTMVVSRGDNLILRLEDVENAKRLLMDAEAWMPEIFKEMGSSSDARELNEIHQFAFDYCDKKKVKSVPEHTLIHFISTRVPINKVSYFIETLINSGLLEKEGLNLPGKRAYTPLSPSLFDPAKG